jgi:hypothetical protein
MKWLLSFFIPHETDFFTPMEDMHRLISGAVKTYKKAAEFDSLTGEAASKLIDDLKSIERQGDEILQQVNASLEKTFTTPFSPHLIRKMFDKLDDVLDQLDESAKTNIHADYRERLPQFAKSQLSILFSGVVLVASTVEPLKKIRSNGHELESILARISEVENDGDRVYWENKKLISKALNLAAETNNLADYREAVMDEKLLDQLEETIDILVEISRVIKGMMIEHA